MSFNFFSRDYEKMASPLTTATENTSRRGTEYISTTKMSTTQLNPRPVRVSPLIKFGRWTFLGAGILYGIFHQNRLAKREVGIREVEAREKVIRDAKLAEEKKRLYEAEVKMLEEMSK